MMLSDICQKVKTIVILVACFYKPPFQEPFDTRKKNMEELLSQERTIYCYDTVWRAYRGKLNAMRIASQKGM
jgi:hypothetical protein